MLSADKRRELGKKELRHREQVALPLHHAGEFGDVRLEPVLLVVLAGGGGKVQDHLVDVVFQRGHFALRLHRDRAGQIALGDGGGHFSDRADLSW